MAETKTAYFNPQDEVVESVNHEQMLAVFKKASEEVKENEKSEPDVPYFDSICNVPIIDDFKERRKRKRKKSSGLPPKIPEKADKKTSILALSVSDKDYTSPKSLTANENFELSSVSDSEKMEESASKFSLYKRVKADLENNSDQKPNLVSQLRADLGDEIMPDIAEASNEESYYLEYDDEGQVIADKC